MRLIDADNIEYTHAIARCIEDGHNWNELCVTKDEIDEIPTVELNPNKKGQWIPKKVWYTLQGISHIDFYCSECNHKSTTYDFCPYCGAYMKGNSDE